MSKKLIEAIDYTKQNKAENRLNYHITPTTGWLNDPNGLVYFKNEYHVFYQTYPYDTNNTNIYWGHMKSRDLVYWEECPIALAPDKDYDINGCFTGSAVVNNEELILMYTGHRLTKGSYIETQNLAKSRDGINFTKYAGNPVIEKSPENTTHRFRDPKLWREEDRFYVVIGGENNNHDGKVVIYETEDLIKFKYKGVLAESKGNLGEVWECPNFINIDNNDILIISPKGLKDKKKFNYPYESGYFIGNYYREKNEFNYGGYCKLDFGHDFYAPQVFKDKMDRNILIGWLGVPEAKLEETRFGWANALTLPRELYINNDKKLCMKPVEELVKLRDKEIVRTTFKLTEEKSFKISNSVEFILNFLDIEDATGILGIKIKNEKEIMAEVLFNPNTNKIIFSRNTTDGIREAVISKKRECLMRVYIDKSTIEIFINDGEVVFSSRVYFKENLTLNITCENLSGEAKLKIFNLKKVF